MTLTSHAPHESEVPRPEQGGLISRARMDELVDKHFQAEVAGDTSTIADGFAEDAEAERRKPPGDPQRELGGMANREVGRVVALWRYPVKSMAPEPLSEVDVSWHGVAGDRRWAFVREAAARSGFPWLTIRERPEMAGYRPSFIEPSEPDRSPTVVRTPGGREFDVFDPALAAELGHGARAMKQDRGVFDAMPLSLITTQTVATLEAKLNTSLDIQRFRPNLLVTADSDAAFPEDAWVGRALRIGQLRMRVDARDGRCVVVNVNPSTGERDPSILRAIAREHQGHLGVYGQVAQPGRVAVGDPVVIEQH